MPSQCSIPDCSSPQLARGWCSKHYQRWRRLGAVALPTAAERFWTNVEFTATCWLWTGAKNNLGYGQIGIDRERVYAHRWAYEFIVGSIPAALELDHLCRVPPCVLPDHLEPVTHRENILRGEGPLAEQARKTHCLRGHEFTEANTYRTPGAPSKRNCRTCQKLRRPNPQKVQALDLTNPAGTPILRMEQDCSKETEEDGAAKSYTRARNAHRHP